ncbi:TetR/AcrR family transcriptional regulator [Beutenbergia cavernae]|nr:TetR family transcriptional regulator [Beutenbergia cavernae]
MRSTRQPGGGTTAAPPSDLTARARIRDGAIRLFGEHGFGVGLRAIAQEAGVSVGLVAHHFGSKDGLREACDAHVLSALNEARRAADVSGPSGAMITQLAAVAEFAPLVAYVFRSVQAGGQLARDFVEHAAADAAAFLERSAASGLVRPSRDEVARARALTSQSIGSLALELALDPPGPGESMSEAIERYVERYTAPLLELYTDGLFTDSSMLDAYLEYERAHPPPTPSSGSPKTPETPRPRPRKATHDQHQ